MSPKKPFTFRFDAVCYAKIKKIAAKENRSMSNYIEYLCFQAAEQFERTHGEIILTDEDLSEK